MADSTWTNPNPATELIKPRGAGRAKFVVGGLLLAAAIVYLIATATAGATQLYSTVDEFYANRDRLVGRDLRVSGWVVGDSIKYTQIDATNSRLEFDIVDDLNNPGHRLHIVALNEPKPDLLQHEAQAIVEGRIHEDGFYYANSGGLFLKCPTRYEDLEQPSLSDA